MERPERSEAERPCRGRDEWAGSTGNRHTPDGVRLYDTDRDARNPLNTWQASHDFINVVAIDAR